MGRQLGRNKGGDVKRTSVEVTKTKAGNERSSGEWGMGTTTGTKSQS